MKLDKRSTKKSIAQNLIYFGEKMIQQFLERRKKIFNQLQDKEAIVVFANAKPSYPRNFLQDKNFFYLTGLNLPNAVYFFGKQNDKPIEMLFIERNIPEMVVWEGAKMDKEEATKISGIERISYLDEFERKIGLNIASLFKIFVNIGFNNIDKPLTKPQVFVNKVKEHFPHLTAMDLTKLMVPLRSIKSKWEVEQLQTAIDVTGAAINKIYQTAQAGMKEYELEAILRFHTTKNGLHHLGFSPIIATGKNATTLHYEENNAKIGKNELVLLDVGVACNNYSADISRTFPVSGTFTKRQKEVYTEVLAINKKIITMVKPGIGMKELNEKTVELIQKSLIKLKLIKDKKNYQKYYMHSVGHHLGLDTHDLGARDSVLGIGNVITVEPGIYIAEEGIGVRIEDDILVTKNGYKNLSENIPKEIDALENLCK